MNKTHNSDFADILEHGKDVILSKSLDGIITYWNQTAVKIFGYNAYEIIGNPISKLIPEKFQEEENNILEKIKKGETVSILKTKRIRKDGTLFSASLTVYPIKNCDGIVTGASTVLNDITKIKKPKRLAHDSINKYRYLFNNNPSPLLIYDFETLRILDCNIECLLLYGYFREEFLQLSIKDIFSAEEAVLLLETIENEHDNSEGNKKVWKHLKKSGELMYVKVTSHKLKYNTKKCSLALINDITATIELERKQKEHVQFIETILENLPIGIAVNNINDGKITLMNQKFSEIYNCPEQDLRDVKAFFENVFPDHKPREETVSEMICNISSKNPERKYWDGITVADQNGKKKVVNAKNIPIYDQNLMISTVVDVTDKFNIQKSLQENTERYHYTTRATSDAIWDWDFIKNQVFRSEGFKTIFGFDLEQLNLDNTKWENYIHPNDRNAVTKSMQDQINGTENHWKNEYRIIKPDGKIAFVQDNGYIIRGENNKVVRIVGAIKDITQRKKEEQHLKLLESVITNTKDTVIITEAEPFDLPGPKILYVNEAFTKMTGYSQEEIIGKSPRILQGPKSDWANLKRIGEAMRRWESCEITTINYKKNGEEFWNNFTLTPIADEKGWFTHWIAIERDVTDQKKYISTLENQNTKLREIAWSQSHVVRAPLARMMGIVSMLSDFKMDSGEFDEWVRHFKDSAKELESIIRDIVSNAQTNDVK